MLARRRWLTGSLPVDPQVHSPRAELRYEGPEAGLLEPSPARQAPRVQLQRRYGARLRPIPVLAPLRGEFAESSGQSRGSEAPVELSSSRLRLWRLQSDAAVWSPLLQALAASSVAVREAWPMHRAPDQVPLVPLVGSLYWASGDLFARLRARSSLADLYAFQDCPGALGYDRQSSALCDRGLGKSSRDSRARRHQKWPHHPAEGD